MEFLYKFCYWLTALSSLCQGIFVLYKNPRSRINITWALLTFVVTLWAAGFIIGLYETDYQKALLFWRISQHAALLITVFYAHFCLALLGKPLSSSRYLIISYIFAIGMASPFLAPWFMPSVSPRLHFHYYPDPGPLYHLHVGQLYSLLLYAQWLLLRHLRAQTPKRQNQIKYVVASTTVGYLFATTAFLLVYRISFNPIPSLFTWVYTLIITYAIMRHQLMDINVAVTRTGVSLVIYLVVLGLPFVVGWWGRGWLEAHVGTNWWLVPLGLCTVLATVGPFAYAWLRRKAEARLLRDQRRYQRILQHAAQGMTRVRDLSKLTRLIVRVVSRTVRVRHASLFLWDKHSDLYTLRASHGPRRLAVQSQYALEGSHPLIQWLWTHRQVLSHEGPEQDLQSAIHQELQRLGAVLVIPGLIEDQLVGFLVLGEKLSGQAYSTDDLHAFSTLAHEAAIAIENAGSYGELVKVNEQLRAAYERLVQQERLAAAGQFAAGMAHEIKNPLSAIKTFAEFLPEKYGDPDFRGKFFRIVQSEIERINTLVQELSDFAKPAPLQVEPVSISALIEDTLALLSNQCLKQGVEVRRGFGEDGLLAQADPKQLKQVMLNLLLNSLEAMGDGGRLEVATEARDSRVVIRITDTGCGIAPEQLDKIWDPFFTTKERGMGLGMAIVKGVVERHGGQIALKSQAGAGTTVEVMLPTVADQKKSR